MPAQVPWTPPPSGRLPFWGLNVGYAANRTSYQMNSVSSAQLERSTDGPTTYETVDWTTPTNIAFCNNRGLVKRANRWLMLVDATPIGTTPSGVYESDDGIAWSLIAGTASPEGDQPPLNYAPAGTSKIYHWRQIDDATPNYHLFDESGAELSPPAGWWGGFAVMGLGMGALVGETALFLVGQNFSGSPVSRLLRIESGAVVDVTPAWVTAADSIEIGVQRMTACSPDGLLWLGIHYDQSGGPTDPVPARMVRSTDGGLSWTELPDAPFSAQPMVYPSDQNHWVSVHGGVAWDSADGGLTWTELPSSAGVWVQALPIGGVL